MLGPDVQYFLDASVEYHNLSVDTYFHFVVQRPDANEYFDRYEQQNRPLPGQEYWHYLQDICLYLEEGYVQWREEYPDHGLACSYAVFMRARERLREFILDSADALLGLGHDRVEPAAMSALNERCGFEMQLGMFERGLMRTRDDLSGYRGNMIDMARRAYERECQRHHERHIACIEAAMRTIRGLEVQEHHWRDEAPSRRRARPARDSERALKRVLKRATKLFERFLGPQQTRLFIGGHSLTVEGRNCLYEITRGRSLIDSHGVSLKLLTKEGVELCNLCIYTPGVPMVDHVVSLLLHIRSGEEEDILRIGNAFSIREEAYEQEWLVPFLPELSIGNDPSQSRNHEALPKLLPNMAEYVISRLHFHLPNDLRDVRMIM